MPPILASARNAINSNTASRQVSRASAQQPTKANGIARPTTPSQVSRGPKPGTSTSANGQRHLVGRNSPQVGHQQSRQALTSEQEQYLNQFCGRENTQYGNGLYGDKKSVRLDDLESVNKPDGNLSLVACKWTADPRLRVNDLGKQNYDSRVRSNGVVVFDCGHTSPPTREPRVPPPVTWHHFDDAGFPVPFQHLCHDCDCHDRFISQKAIIQVNQLPLKLLRLNERIATITKAKGLRKPQNISDDPEISELREELRKLIMSRDRHVWSIWAGWEKKWGEELFMNESGYVYAPNPVVKGLEFVFPPENSDPVRRRPDWI